MVSRAKRASDILRFLTSDDITESERDTIREALKVRKSKKAKNLIAILFPEFTQPVRLPNRFGQITSVFRTYRYFDITPISGKFAVVFNPKQLYMQASGAFAYGSTLTGFDSDSYPICSMYTAIDSSGNVIVDQSTRHIYADNCFDYFDECALRAAVIRVYYIGSALEKKGYMCGAIDYGQDIKTTWQTGLNGTAWNTTQIENGHYKRFGDPDSGMRFIWYPKDEEDLQFVTIDQARAENYQRNQQTIMMYGVNLADDATLRVDIVRHIEGLPKHNVRAYMQMRRPEPGEPDDVYEDLAEISGDLSDLISLNLKEAALVKDSVSEIINEMYGDDVAPVYNKYGQEDIIY
jgi:hypothetical protein